MRELLDIVAYVVFFLSGIALFLLFTVVTYSFLGWYGIASLALLVVIDALPDWPLWMVKRRCWHSWFDRGALALGIGLPLLGLLSALHG